MDAAAPAIFQALEASAFGAGIRQSTWIYPAANIGHVLAVVTFAGAVAVLDARLLGAFRETRAADVVAAARKAAIAAFLCVLATGAVLFAAEASHLVLNRVFQLKMLLLCAGLANVVLFERMFRNRLADIAPPMPMPAAARACGAVSLAAWLAVAGLGRSIAYF